MTSFSGDKGRQMGTVVYASEPVTHSASSVFLSCVRHCAGMSWGKEINNMQFLSGHPVGQAINGREEIESQAKGF